jgi:hypothetical protein
LFEEFENIEMKLFHYSGNKAAMYAFGCIWNHLDALVFCRNRASITEAAVRANLLSSRIAVDTHVDL